jgi:hypothetical protein
VTLKRFKGEEKVSVYKKRFELLIVLFVFILPLFGCQQASSKMIPVIVLEVVDGLSP